MSFQAIVEKIRYMAIIEVSEKIMYDDLKMAIIHYTAVLTYNTIKKIKSDNNELLAKLNLIKLLKIYEPVIKNAFDFLLDAYLNKK